MTGEVGTLDVDGRSVAVRLFGAAGTPGVVLVHGGAAHSGWWDEVAALLAPDHHVVVLDLSGHGDSSHAAEYGFDTWADEVIAAAELVSAQDAPTLVGHSMGGMVCLRAASRDVRLRGVVVVDSAIRDYPAEELEPWLRNVDCPPRVQPSMDEILRRFTLFDQAPGAPEDVVRRLGRQAVAPRDGGWVWKFDRRTFAYSVLSPAELRPVAQTVALVRGDGGDMSSAICDAIRIGIGQASPVYVVAGSGHHVPVEQPTALSAILRRLVAEWA